MDGTMVAVAGSTCVHACMLRHHPQRVANCTIYIILVGPFHRPHQCFT